MAKEGSKRIAIAGTEDKRQITAVFAGSMAGDFTDYLRRENVKVSSSVIFPSGWHATTTENHWANEKTMDYINLVLLPYIQ